MVIEQFLQDKQHETPQSSATDHALTLRFTKHHHPDHDKLHPYFLNIPAKSVKHTLNKTTQVKMSARKGLH